MRGILKTAFFGFTFFLLVSPVILVSAPPKNGDCGEIPTDDCLKKLQTFLHISSLPMTTDNAKLDDLCYTAVGGYNCSSKRLSTPNCLSIEEKALFSVFINMAEYSFFMFCKTGPDSQAYLRSAMLENAECILKQKNAIDCCVEQSKVPDLPIMYILDQSGKSLPEKQIATCCPVSNYLKCVELIVKQNCGEVAGNFTVEYIRRAVGQGVDEVCQKLHNYPEPDPEVCKDPAPVCAACKVQNFMLLIMVFSLFFITWINQV